MKQLLDILNESVFDIDDETILNKKDDYFKLQDDIENVLKKNKFIEATKETNSRSGYSSQPLCYVKDELETHQYNKAEFNNYEGKYFRYYIYYILRKPHYYFNDEKNQEGKYKTSSEPSFYLMLDVWKDDTGVLHYRFRDLLLSQPGIHNSVYRMSWKDRFRSLKLSKEYYQRAFDESINIVIYKFAQSSTTMQKLFDKAEAKNKNLNQSDYNKIFALQGGLAK